MAQESAKEVIDYIKARADDISNAQIACGGVITVKQENGQEIIAPNAGMILVMMGGENLLVHKDDVAAVLNDGILNRMRIPISCVFDPKATSPDLFE